MKTRLALLAAMVGLVFAFQPALAQDCAFQLGFKTLHDLIPDVVGQCVDDEQHNPATGITQQATTHGRLTWRKADNWTGFTDGQHTWINGPEGLQQRLNGERFPWEAALPAHTATQRLTLEQLRNAEYRLPLLGDQDTPIRLVDGMGTLVYGEGATERETVGLIDDAIAFGDLDGDGNADAAVVLFTSGGGSGAFIYLVAVLDRDGAPSQTARAYLGDRARVESLSISGGRVLAQILAHGPEDALCCPSLHTTSTFALREGGLIQQRLTLEQLRNAEYRLPLLGDQDAPIRLVDGMGTLVYGEGATERQTVGIVNDTVAFGDLDGDGIADAAVVVFISGGGSGTFIHLVAVLDRNGAPEQAAWAFLGDRVPVRNLAVTGGRIVAHTVTHRPSDGLCCPTLEITRTFGLEGDQLVPRQALVIESPLPGETVASGVEIRGTSSVNPAAQSLAYLVYDARGGVIGMGSLPVDGYGDQPGTFAARSNSSPLRTHQAASKSSTSTRTTVRPSLAPPYPSSCRLLPSRTAEPAANPPPSSCWSRPSAAPRSAPRWNYAAASAHALREEPDLPHLQPGRNRHRPGLDLGRRRLRRPGHVYEVDRHPANHRPRPPPHRSP